MENLGKIEYKQEEIISRFDDLRRKDLSTKNLVDISVDVSRTTEFDTETIWPEKEKLPKNFDPEKLLEESKNPGLGIRELHKQGIDGRGIVVAIIDQKLDVDHQEYKGSIWDYSEYGEAKDEDISMHGPAVASLLVGKDCGVAPGAKLVYKAVPSGRNFLFQAQALSDILDSNKNLPQNEKVRVVSCSIGYMPENPELGLDEWVDTLKKAKEAGIFVVDANGDQLDVSFGGGGSPENKNNFESYLPWLYEDGEDEGNEELNKIITEGNVDKILKKIREIGKDEFANIPDLDLRKKIEKHLLKRKKEIVVPSDYRTMASSWNKEG